MVHAEFLQALRGIPTLITITPMVLLYESSDVTVTLQASWNALLGSNTLLEFTHIKLHFTTSDTLLEAPGVQNTFCKCIRHCYSDKIQVNLKVLLIGIAWCSGHYT
jgi:hypothetical protein